MNNSVIRGRAETPGHRSSPGVQHSPAAEIATQQFKEYAPHAFTLPSVLFTNLFAWYVGIIVLLSGLVNRMSEIFPPDAAYGSSDIFRNCKFTVDSL